MSAAPAAPHSAASRTEPRQSSAGGVVPRLAIQLQGWPDVMHNSCPRTRLLRYKLTNAYDAAAIAVNTAVKPPCAISSGRTLDLSHWPPRGKKSAPARGFPQAGSHLTLLRGWIGRSCARWNEDRLRRREKFRRAVHFKTTSATGGLPRLIAFTRRTTCGDAENNSSTNGAASEMGPISGDFRARIRRIFQSVLPLPLHGFPLVLVFALAKPCGRRWRGEIHHVAAVPALWPLGMSGRNSPQRPVRIRAGGAASLSLEKAVFAGRGLENHNFYGASECGGIATCPFRDPSRVCRRALEKRPACPVGGDGCSKSAAVRGKNLLARTVCKSCEGLLPHQRPRRDQPRLVCLRGRAGDQITSRPQALAGDNIEKALLSHPHVKECVVLARRAPTRTERNHRCLRRRRCRVTGDC